MNFSSNFIEAFPTYDALNRSLILVKNGQECRSCPHSMCHDGPRR
uniref:Uncharacterized protein n=1 Tax=Rhizophora mucronata TaxID=61149 RepID=A0A2P2NB83_RHIMU